MTKMNTNLQRFAALTLLTGALCAPLAQAQLSDFQRPFGFAPGEQSQPFDPNTRDINGNRLIVDGRIVVGEDLSSFSSSTLGSGGQALSGAGFFGQGFGSSAQNSAIGNQLNVITQGSFNTVVIDSTQINNGNQTAIQNQSGDTSNFLNGELDLND